MTLLKCCNEIFMMPLLYSFTCRSKFVRQWVTFVCWSPFSPVIVWNLTSQQPRAKINIFLHFYMYLKCILTISTVTYETIDDINTRSSILTTSYRTIIDIFCTIFTRKSWRKKRRFFISITLILFAWIQSYLRGQANIIQEITNRIKRLTVKLLWELLEYIE